MRIEDLTNRIISGSASLIAVVALGAALYQSKLMRDQARASVWPYLIQGNSGANGYSRIVQNVGLGPALIKSFEVDVDGKPRKNWADVANALGIKLSFRDSKTSSFRTGWVVPTNTMIDLIELPDTSDIRLFRSQVERVTTITCFCSLYGDCWRSSSKDSEPTQVKECKIDPVVQFKE